jgi:hypothetical protein
MAPTGEHEHAVIHGLSAEFYGFDMIFIEEIKDFSADAVRSRGESNAFDLA